MVMTVAAFLGVLAGIMARVGLWGGLGRSGGGRDSGAAIAVLLIPLISAAVYAVSFLLTRLLSRYRELSADRAAALLTGRPSASGVGADQGDRADGRHPDPGPAEGGAVQRLLVRAAFSSKDSLGRLLSSHPTLEQRLGSWPASPPGWAARRRGAAMGFLDVPLGRSKPVRPDLDRLFAVPGAAITLEAGAGFVPTGAGSVCFAGVEGGAFGRLCGRRCGDLLDADVAADPAGGGSPSRTPATPTATPGCWRATRRTRWCPWSTTCTP